MTLAHLGDADSHKAAAAIVREAYKRLGIMVEFINPPWKRSLVLSNNGKLDGEVARLTVIEEAYQNLVRVPVPLYQIEAVGFSLSDVSEIGTWQDLSGMKVGVELGFVLADKNTQGLHRVFSQNVQELATMLGRGSIDLLVSDTFAKSQIQKNANLSGKRIHATAPLQSSSLYHYVHKSHSDLVSALSATLTAMKIEGEFERLGVPEP